MLVPTKVIRMRNILIAVLLSVLASVLVVKTMVPATGAAAPAARETAYERVMRTGVIRCGYFVWEPLVMKDPNTGDVSGLIVDYVNAIAQASNLKVDWSQEVNIGTYLQDLKSGRYDVECIGGWPNPERAKLAAYTKPLAYYPLYPWVRMDDNRFDKNMNLIGQKETRIAMVDGGTDTRIYETMFSGATPLRLPQMAGGVSDLIMQVVTKKADILFSDVAAMEGYMKANPNTMRPLMQFPVQLKKLDISVAQGEQELLNFLNEVGDMLMSDGTVERILKKYEKTSGTYLRIMPDYINQ